MDEQRLPDIAIKYGQRCVGQAVCAGMHSAEPCRSPFTPSPLYFMVAHFNLLMPCRTCMGEPDLLTHMTLGPLGVLCSFPVHMFPSGTNVNLTCRPYYLNSFTLRGARVKVLFWMSH